MIDRKQQAIEKGEEDYKNGVEFNKNPYIYLTKFKILAGYWEQGYNYAKKESKNGYPNIR